MSEPIFPSIGVPNTPDHFGLTKRELFAAMAMQGLIAQGFKPPYTMDDRRTVGSIAVDHADSLIRALDK